MSKPTVTEPEIKITPEMIAAGRRELATFNEDFESREEFLERLYEAMYLASISRRSAPSIPSV